MQRTAVPSLPEQARFLTHVLGEETHEKTAHLLEEILGRKLKGLSFVGTKQHRVLGQSGASAEANDTSQGLFGPKHRLAGLVSPVAGSKDAEVTSLGQGPARLRLANLRDSLESTKKDTAASKEKQTENVTNLTGNRSDRLSEAFEFRIKRVPSRDESDYLSNSADKHGAGLEAQTELLGAPDSQPQGLKPERALTFGARSSERQGPLGHHDRCAVLAVKDLAFHTKGLCNMRHRQHF